MVVLLLVPLLVVVTNALAETFPGWIGVYIGRQVGEASARDAESAQHGIPVAGVISGSPAERAGIRARDRIASVEGRSVSSFNELRQLLSETVADQWVQIAVDRAGERIELDARLAERPADTSHMRVRTGWIGVHAIDLPASLRTHFGAPSDAGVMLSDVEPQGPAFIAGLEIGDVVFEIDGDPVESASDLGARLQRAGVGNTVEIVLVRFGAEIKVEATIDEAGAEN